jgi:hypothetical protein
MDTTMLTEVIRTELTRESFLADDARGIDNLVLDLVGRLTEMPQPATISEVRYAAELALVSSPLVDHTVAETEVDLLIRQISAAVAPQLAIRLSDAERQQVRRAVDLIQVDNVVEFCRDCRDEAPIGAPATPADFLIWGKMFAPEALGPKCYAHAQQHLGSGAMGRLDQYAVLDLRGLRRAPVA